MKFPSLQHVVAEALRVLRRFPLTLLCGFILGGISIYHIHLDFQEAEKLTWIFPALSAAGLGLTLTLAIAIAAERYQWPEIWRWTGQAGAVVLLGIWYSVVPSQLNIVWGTRLTLLLVGLHLAVAAGPYLSELRRHRADTPGFWRYNETLFLRILTALLYSGVLYAGCALALLAIENLFDVKLNHHVYGDLFAILGTVFNTWFFLAGVPHDFAALEQDAPYPKGLKLFTQFVLLPLVVLYLGILYAYLGRILVLWTLPKGWVSTLVLALAVAGIFALLLIHPIRNTAENAWIRTFARWFYRALFPLLALLAVAIGTRIHAYGITEERYFVLVLAGWLFGMAVYFLRNRGVGIIWIPASLAAVAFLSAAGPWGAFAVAERSQLRQLVTIGQQYGLLRNGHLDAAGQHGANLSLHTRLRITSIFDFFADRNATAQLQPLFVASLALPDSLQTASHWQQKMWQAEQLFTLSGLQRVSSFTDERDIGTTLVFRTENSDIQSLGNGRYWINEISPDYNNTPNKVVAEASIMEGTFRLQTFTHGRQLRLEQLRANGDWQNQLTLTPGALADSLARISTGSYMALSNQALTLHTATNHIALHLYLRNLTRYQLHDSVSYSYSAQALLELK